MLHTVATEECEADRLHAAAIPSGTKDREALDLEAVNLVCAGDVHAFSVIVERWQGPLLNLAWRYCRDRGRAEEMAQEAFLRIWKGLPGWRRESSFSTWLFSVAANVYRSELKRVPACHVSLDSISEPSQPFRKDAEMDRFSLEDAVRRAVLALPYKYREPLILFYFHEMDLSSAAATMQIPEGTMKARLARGRMLLRQRFPLLEEQTDQGEALTKRANHAAQWMHTASQALKGRIK